MDLSKVPDLELRKKVKPLADKIDALDDRMSDIRNAYDVKAEVEIGPLRAERNKLDEELGKLLGDEREIVGTCSRSGLPIFYDDETVEIRSLAYVEAA